MRDLLILAIIFGSIPICFFSPYYGILVWFWITFFNPHRYAWGVAYNFPVAMMIAIPTLLGTVFTRKINRIFVTREVVILLMLWIWFVATLVHAYLTPELAGHIDPAKEKLINVSKILLTTFLTVLLVTSKTKLKNLFLVIAMSIGMKAIFSAIWGLQHGGDATIYGPAESFIADNNAFALALNMILPLLFFLARDQEHKRLRYIMFFAFLSSVVCVVLTYSRGGLLGLATVLAVIAIKAHRKLLTAAALLLCFVLILLFAPPKWMDRMNHFFAGELDSSAQERLITWHMGFNLAKQYPIFGGGFETFPDVAVYQKYAPEPLPGGHQSTGPHSIYFQMLGEHGFVGLGLFLALLLSCISSLRKLRRIVHHPPDHWILGYSHMIEASIYAFMVSGAFLEFAHFDLWYLMVACTAILKILYQQDIMLSSPTAAQTDHGLVSPTPPIGKGVLEPVQ